MPNQIAASPSSLSPKAIEKRCRELEGLPNQASAGRKKFQRQTVNARKQERRQTASERPTHGVVRPNYAVHSEAQPMLGSFLGPRKFPDVPPAQLNRLGEIVAEFVEARILKDPTIKDAAARAIEAASEDCARKEYPWLALGTSTVGRIIQIFPDSFSIRFSRPSASPSLAVAFIGAGEFKTACSELARWIRTTAAEKAATNSTPLEGSLSTKASAKSSTEEAGIYTVQQVADMAGLGTDSLGTYTTKAGVRRAGRGRRDHRFTTSETIAILDGVVKHCTSQTFIQKAKSSLQEIRNKPAENPNTRNKPDPQKIDLN